MPEFVKPDGTADVWYVDKDSAKGFTSLAENALLDSRGRPVIASGHVRLLAGRMMESSLERLEQLWSYYLDMMEKDYELQEANNAEGGTEGDFNEMWMHQKKMEGVLDALCVMEYGWLFSKQPDESRRLVQNRADIRYARESE